MNAIQSPSNSLIICGVFPHGSSSRSASAYWHRNRHISPKGSNGGTANACSGPCDIPGRDSRPVPQDSTQCDNQTRPVTGDGHCCARAELYRSSLPTPRCMWPLTAGPFQVCQRHCTALRTVAQGAATRCASVKAILLRNARTRRGRSLGLHLQLRQNAGA